MSAESAKFNAADIGVFGICELIAVPLCHAGWDAVVSDEHLARGIAALMMGLPLGLLGASFHWWKEKISTSKSEWIQHQANRWWLAAFFLAFIYLAGPNIYLRSTTPVEITRQTGRIIWNFEQTARGGGAFLSLQKVGDQEIRVIGFGAHGKNNSSDPVSQLSGYMRSDRTNEQVPIYVLAQLSQLGP
jgi:hypothetical protein